MNRRETKNLKYTSLIKVVKQALIANSFKSMSKFFTKKCRQKPTQVVLSEHAEDQHGDPGLPGWTRVYIEYFTWLVVLHVCQESNFKNYNTELIFQLATIVSDKLEGEEFDVNPKAFKNLNKTIKKVLQKTFGSPEAALFYLTSGDPLMVECIISVIRKQVMVPPKSQSAAHRFFSDLGKALSKPLSCSLLNYATCGLRDCAHLDAPLLRPRR